ncbi:MAG: FAD-dependent oxidoreductase [Steroidobacteraceae bacterium]
MSRKDTQPRIAIIGAGPAGLSAAWYLKQNGYRNVRVFEKTGRVGGKCLTFEHGGRQFDLAAHEMLAGYTDVMEIATALGVPSAGHQKVLVYNTDAGRYMSMLEASQSGGYGTLQIMWASLRYTWMLLTRYRKFARPGSGYADAPSDLLQPLSSWIQQKRLGALLETILYVMRVQGYGRLDEIPAAYFVKFQGLRNWVSNVLHVAGLIQRWPRVFKHGFQSVWDAVARHVDVLFNAGITAVRRAPKPGSSNLVVTIEFGDARPSEEFDFVIVTCPLDLPTLTALGLDLHQQEKHLLEQVRYVEFITTACEVEGVPSGVVGSIPVPPMLDYTGYIKIYRESPVAIFFTLAPTDGYDPAEVVERIKRQVRTLPDVGGGPSTPGSHPHVTGVVRQQGWQYFPHVTLTDFRAGFYDQFESLQGYLQTYYSGSLLAYETVGTTVAYSRRLVERYFPRLD